MSFVPEVYKLVVLKPEHNLLENGALIGWFGFLGLLTKIHLRHIVLAEMYC